MFSITENPDNDYKLAVFQPIVYKGDITTDQYPSGGSFIDQFVNITGVNEDGNCICEFVNSQTPTISDMIYLIDGIYKGKHKIYRVNGSTNFHILTKFTATETNSSVHYICADINNTSDLRGKCRIQKYVTGSPVTLIDLYPFINENSNTWEIDISGYLKKLFANTPILSDDIPNPSSTHNFTFNIEDFTQTSTLLFASKTHAEMYSKLNASSSASALIKPFANKIILFQKYQNVVPFNIPDGVYEMFIYPNNDSLTNYITLLNENFTFNNDDFEICSLCVPEALPIHFINKFGAFQTYVPIGNYSFGKTFIDPKDIVNSKAAKQIADSGMIYKACTIEMQNLNKSHIEVLEELIESPIAFIWDGTTVQECIIEKKDFEFYKTVNEYHVAKISLIFSEKINVQTR